MKRCEIKAGELALRAGDRGDTAYFILSGTVEVFAERDGRHVALAQLGKGEIFGEMAVIDPGPRSASVRAIEDTICIVTTYDDFTRSMAENPQFATEFLRTLVARLRDANTRIIELSDGRDEGLRKLLQKHGRDRMPLV
jgi:serine/threonine-protein kinase